MRVSQTDLVVVMLNAIDRIAPNLVVDQAAMNALIAAAWALEAANREPTPAERLRAAGFPDRGLRDHLPLAVCLSDEEQLATLDNHPGWGAA